MQFREFGEWITRIANVHDPINYVLLVSPQDQEAMLSLIEQAGIEDRFVCYELPALAPGRMMVIAEVPGVEATVDTTPFFEALHAAIAANLKDQLVEDAADRMDDGRPYKLTFQGDHPPLDESATHPHGEIEAGV